MASYPLSPTCKPWERQPTEGAGEFAAFVDFLLSAPPRRISDKRGPQAFNTAYLWSWVIRADAYDTFLDVKRLELAEETYLERARRHAVLVRKEQLVGEKGLDAALQEFARASADGGNYPLDIVRPAVASRLVNDGIRLEREVLDSLPPIVTASEDLSRLTDEDMATLVALLTKARTVPAEPGASQGSPP